MGEVLTSTGRAGGVPASSHHGAHHHDARGAGRHRHRRRGEEGAWGGEQLLGGLRGLEGQNELLAGL